MATCSGLVGHQATPVTSRACPRSATGLAHGLSTCAAVHAQCFMCTHMARPKNYSVCDLLCMLEVLKAAIRISALC